MGIIVDYANFLKYKEAFFDFLHLYDTDVSQAL